jgi:hypothetical protein
LLGFPSIFAGKTNTCANIVPKISARYVHIVVDTLLPKTAIIGFQSFCLDEMSVIVDAAAEWDRVREVVGDLMEPIGLYPERYRVRSFPNPDQIEAIKGDGRVLHELLRQGGTARQP